MAADGSDRQRTASPARVSRPGLVAKLANAPAVALLLAAPGYGKTTLLRGSAGGGGRA